MSKYSFRPVILSDSEPESSDSEGRRSRGIWRSIHDLPVMTPSYDSERSDSVSPTLPLEPWVPEHNMAPAPVQWQPPIRWASGAPMSPIVDSEDSDAPPRRLDFQSPAPKVRRTESINLVSPEPARPPPIQIPEPVDYDEPKPRSVGQCWLWTHFLHDEAPNRQCAHHPRRVCELKSQRNTWQMIGGGYQTEKCPKTGKLHLQGWMSLDKEIQFMTLKPLFCQKIRWTKMDGSVAQNIAYCSKPDSRITPYVAFGDQDCLNPHEKQEKGARNDLLLVKRAMDSGVSMKRIRDDYFETFLRYSNGLKYARSLDENSFVEQTREFIVLMGPKGTGKSWFARQIIGNDSSYRPQKNNAGILSFESYDGQKWILMEEFNKKSLDIDTLKEITDRYKCTLPGRGFSPYGLHTGVIITMNHDPQNLCDTIEDWEALRRRMTTWIWATEAPDRWQNKLTGQFFDSPFEKIRATLRANAVPVVDRALQFNL